MVTNQSTTLSTCTPEFNSFFQTSLGTFTNCLDKYTTLPHRLKISIQARGRVCTGFSQVQAQTLLDRNLQVVQAL